MSKRGRYAKGKRVRRDLNRLARAVPYQRFEKPPRIFTPEDDPDRALTFLFDLPEPTVEAPPPADDAMIERNVQEHLGRFLQSLRLAGVELEPGEAQKIDVVMGSTLVELWIRETHS